MVVRPQSGRRGNRVARRRRRGGRGGRCDELLHDAARRRRNASGDPGERRHGRALPRTGRLLDARAGERGGGCRLRVAAHGDVPERQLVPDLHPQARLDRPAAAPAVGASPPRLGSRPLRARARRRRGWHAASGRHRAQGARSRGSARRPLRARAGRARGSRCGRLRQPLLPRRRVLQLALPRLPARLPLLRRVSRRRPRRRRSRRPHVQARGLRGLPRRPRRDAGRRRGRPRARRSRASGR